MQPQFPLSGSNNEEDAKNICCQERQSLFYAVTRSGVIISCSVCKFLTFMIIRPLISTPQSVLVVRLYNSVESWTYG